MTVRTWFRVLRATEWARGARRPIAAYFATGNPDHPWSAPISFYGEKDMYDFVHEVITPAMLERPFVRLQRQIKGITE